MSDAFPRPSKLLATASALNIAGNLFLLSAYFAATSAKLIHSAVTIGLIVLPLCSLTAVQQYRGTFRRVPSAAKMTSVLLYVCGGFVLFGIVTTVSAAVLGEGSLRPIASFLILMQIVALFCLAVGRMNARWSRTLEAATASGAVVPLQQGFSLRELILAVGVVAAMIGVTLQMIRSQPPRYAENIDASAAPFELPVGATEISYCKGNGGMIAFEFTTDESAFREWVNSGIGSIESQSARIPLREITAPFTIVGYRRLAPELDGPVDMTINSGIYYSWSAEDRGVHAVFDRSTGRAYYHAHFH